MARTVRARQHDTLDAICYRVYGRTQGVTEQVLKANPGFADLGPILPHGTPVRLPDIAPEPPRRPTVQLWT
ncbi:tail protein X [Halomonas sp. H5]|uniref:tail protein X n=1 Tax=Halomonas sp. H5 TaxID=3423910 RepID=UPI003D369A6C